MALMKPHSIKQKGHAALLFVLLIPVIFGFLTLGLDGARAIQDKARMGDAIEVAALSLSAQNSTNNDENIALAVDVIQAYFSASDISEEDIVVQSVNLSECSPESKTCYSPQVATKYTVDAQLVRSALLPESELWGGFEDAQYTVRNVASASRYLGDSLDLVFVADYSGSMLWTWSENGNNYGTRYVEMHNILNQVVAEIHAINESGTLEKDELNRVGFVGFDTDTFELQDYTLGDNSKCDQYVENECEDELRSGLVACQRSCPWFNNRNCQKQCEKDYQHDVEMCKVSKANSDNYVNYNEASYIRNNSKNTANKWLEDGYVTNLSCVQTNDLSNLDHFTLNLTSDLSKNSYFSSAIEDFKPYSNSSGSGKGTYSYQGVIKAGQMLEYIHSDSISTIPNPRRLIIILTDGDDSDENYSSSVYGKNALCEKIRTELSNDTSHNSRITESKMAMVGFAYDADQNTGMKSCVGDDNLFKAENPDELLSIILQLISEEIGHLN